MILLSYSTIDREAMASSAQGYLSQLCENRTMPHLTQHSQLAEKSWQRLGKPYPSLILSLGYETKFQHNQYYISPTTEGGDI